jgi:Domain of unknown function (DUF4426)
MKNNVLISATLALCLASSLAGCNRDRDSRQPSAEIQPALTSSESFKTSGEYEMHYNAVRTDQLTPDIARAYSIERSKNKVLLNISVLHKDPSTNMASATDADIELVVHNLNGQLKDVQLRRIAETTATYYIGDVSFSGAETLVFEIKATPAGSAIPIEATLTREFFAD